MTTLKPEYQKKVEELCEKYGKEYTIKSEPHDYIHKGLNNAEFLSHFKKDLTTLLLKAQEREEEARKKGAEREETVVNLLEQIIEMNGEDWFWSYLAKMPITKFNGSLKKALTPNK